MVQESQICRSDARFSVKYFGENQNMLSLLMFITVTAFSACHDKSSDLPLNVVAPKCESRWIDQRSDDPRCYDLQEKLAKAASVGDVSVIKAALEQGANVNGGYSQSFSALWLAASEGRNLAVRFLILSGAEVNRIEGEGNTALKAAITYDHPDTIRILIDGGGLCM